MPIFVKLNFCLFLNKNPHHVVKLITWNFGVLMRKIFIFIVNFFLITGCATSSSHKPKPSFPRLDSARTDNSVESLDEELSQLENIRDEDMEPYLAQKGVIFGKTVFEGVLKTSYVKLRFEGVDENDYKYDLYIGDKASQASFLWDVKVVQPGYFFIELPAGAYKIKSIAIPVGSTVAEEVADIDVVVTSASVAYVGTLTAVGTRERIRLGGVPVIRPGFEYQLSVLDHFMEAEKIFSDRFPLFEGKIIRSILKVNPVPGVEQ